MAKWTGLGICAIFALAFAATPWWYFGWRIGSSHVDVMSGSIHLIGVEGLTWDWPRWESGRNLYMPSQWPSQLCWWISIEPSSEITTIMTTTTGTRRPIKQRTPSYIIMPLWIPFILVAVPTAILWWHDRRRHFRAGRCRRCGYDLTGNVSGRCPECGAPIDGVVSESTAQGQ
jgi:hypothetical protein